MIKHHRRRRNARGACSPGQGSWPRFQALDERLLERKQALIEEFKHGAKLPPPETRSFTGHELVQGEPVDAGAAG